MHTEHAGSASLQCCLVCQSFQDTSSDVISSPALGFANETALGWSRSLEGSITSTGMLRLGSIACPAGGDGRSRGRGLRNRRRSAKGNESLIPAHLSMAWSMSNTTSTLR